MARPKIKLMPELREQLRQKMRSAQQAKDKERLQAAWLASSGQHSLEEIATLVGRARSAVQRWLDQLRKGGIEGLLRRRKAPGATPALGPAEVEALRAQLRAGQQRSAVQLQRWMKQQLGKELKLGAVYYWLGKLAGVLRAPRPVHVKKDPLASMEWRAQLLQRLQSLPVHPGAPVRVWVTDECRFGLHSFTRKVWTLRGCRPVAPSQQKFNWEYLYGALECSSGQAVFAYLPKATLEASLLFAREVSKSEPEAQHILIQDGAGFHLRPGDVRLPANVQVLILPPYSPELNPIEKLWDILKDAVCNKAYPSIRALRQSLTPELKAFWSEPHKVLRLIGRNWFSQIVNASSQMLIPVFN